MIEVVTYSDLHRLGAIKPHVRGAKQRAVGILMEIVGRLPRPRAYVSEPTHMVDVVQQTLWCQAYDQLSVTLQTEALMSIVEPETIRDLSLFCCVLEKLSDACDPLWQTLAACKYIDAICIPSDGENSKRHAAMRRHAEQLQIRILSYRPELVRYRRVSTRPPP